MESKKTSETCGTKAVPEKEHRWLEKFIGEWDVEGEAKMAPDQPFERFRGSERVRSLGGLWIVAEGEMPGGEGGAAVTTIMTIGYDPHRWRFVGTFIASMMTHLWLYEGALDDGERVLTLETEGPDMNRQGKMVRYKDVHELKGDGHRVLTSIMLGEDGNWHEFMRADYRRRK
jgi:hypothetical protein